MFKKEKKTDESDRHKKREKYMNSKKPNRPDVTKQETDLHSASKSVAKRERGEENTDHVGEITQLKEKIVFLEKTIKQKENQMIIKDQEITQMKAKLFNEEKLIREKMKMMAKVNDDKTMELNSKIRSLQNEISKLRKDAKPVKLKKLDNLFKDSNRRKVSSRTASPVTRSRSRSPVNRAKSKSPSPNPPARSPRSSPSRSPSPAAKVPKLDSPMAAEEPENAGNVEGNLRNSRSPSPDQNGEKSRSTSKSPGRDSRSRSRSKSSSP